MFWNVLVPEVADFGLGSPLARPLLYNRAMDHVDRFHEEGARSRSGVKNRYESILLVHSVRDIDVKTLRHLAPRGRVGQPLVEVELVLQQLVDRADDV